MPWAKILGLSGAMQEPVYKASSVQGAEISTAVAIKKCRQMSIRRGAGTAGTSKGTVEVSPSPASQIGLGAA